MKILTFFNFSIFSFLLCFQNTFLSARGFSIIGGRNNSDIRGYAALISPSGIVTPIELPPVQNSAEEIFSVAINPSGYGIVGGLDVDDNAYVARISPLGVASPLTGPGLTFGQGTILDVDINNSGVAIIGGSAEPFALLVSPSGVTTPLTGNTLPQAGGTISAVAINDSGSAIVGGTTNGTNSYSALVTPNGVTSPITGTLPTGTSNIRAVDINSSGSAIMGGLDDNAVYAAFVSPSGVATFFSGGDEPFGPGTILSVSINESNQSIIGGNHNGNLDPYAAFFSPTGIATTFTGNALPQGTGQINSVAINNSGFAIIGGRDRGNTSPYAALVSPSGVTTALSGQALPQGRGRILSVAINDSGSAVIGGQDSDNTNLYATLVSPSGVTTALSGQALPSTGFIQSVDIASRIDPTSFGPGNAFSDTLFALSTSILHSHLEDHSDPFPFDNYGLQMAQLKKQSKEIAFQSLTADAEERLERKISKINQKLKRRQEKLNRKGKAHVSENSHCKKANKICLWATPYGVYSRAQPNAPIPRVRNWATGGLIGCDYMGFDSMVLGGGFAYAYQGAALSENAGHSHFNQELLTAYYTQNIGYLSVEGSLWGGLYQMKNNRTILNVAEARSTVHGWLFCPHIESSYTILNENGTNNALKPFVMLDWANNWQRPVKEKGEADLNLEIGAQYVSILRSEIGSYFMQSYFFGNGSSLNFKVSLSYVNQVPFNVNQQVPVSYISSPTTFFLQVFNNKIQNLGAIRANLNYRSKGVMNYSLNYQGQLGAKLLSYVFSFEVGVKF